MNPDLLDDLSLLVDGDRAARTRHAATLANDDEARDLVHDAEALAERVASAGADYVAPADFEARVLASLGKGRSAFVDAPAPKPRSGAVSDAVQPGKPRLGWLFAGAAAMALLLVGGAGFGYRAYRASRASGVVQSHVEGWHGQIAWVTPDGDGVRVSLVAADGHAAPAGTSVAAGARVETDERTRARVTLVDGTTFDLGRSSVLALDARRARSARLLSGTALVDVAHVDGSHAFVGLAHGEVEVLGTKFAVASTPTESRVEVLRGRVRFASSKGATELDAGREAVLRGDGAIRVTYGSGRAFAELGTVPKDDADAVLPGLGELRARRPGERTERERPLRIEATEIAVDLVGHVARTEVTQTFRNDDDATLEGLYRFPLPDGARIAKLALEVEGRWEEGAFVDRERGEQIFRGVIRHATPRPEQRPNEEFVWVPGPWRDPALLEWQRGGRVELRVFPIAGHSARRVRLVYEESMPTDGVARRYVYPFPSVRRGDARVGHLSTRVRVHGAGPSAVQVAGYAARVSATADGAEVVYEATDFAPAGGLELAFDEANPGAELRYSTFEGSAVSAVGDDSRERPEVRAAQTALAADDRGYASFALRPRFAEDRRLVPTDVVVVVDSSQSMVGERYALARRVVRSLVEELDPRHRITVLACDLGCRSAGAFVTPSGVAAEELDHFLAGVSPAGSTDLARALATAATHLDARPDRDRVLLYVGDGVGTVGATEHATLADFARTVRTRSDTRVSAIGLGDDADASALALLANEGAGVYVPFLPGGRAELVAADALAPTRGALLEGVSVELPRGLEAVAPAALPNLVGGAEARFAARVTSDVDGDLVLRGKVDGTAFERRYPVHIRRSEVRGNAFVPRLWAEARIADLERAGGDAASAESVALSRGYGVLSKRTALLVLESDAMFHAFGVDRPTTSLDFDANSFSETTVEVEERGDVDELVGGDVASRGRAAAPSAPGSGAIAYPFNLAAAEAGTTTTRPAPAPAPAVSPHVLDDGFARPRREPTPPRPGRWARRVWFKVANVAAASELPRFDPAPALARHLENPDSRDRLKALVEAYLRAGDDAAASRYVETWRGRDPGDTDALAYAAEIALRAGRRDEAVRLLSGIVESAPNERALHERLVGVFEALDDVASACAHRTALAKLLPSDSALGDAARACGAPRPFGERAPALVSEDTRRGSVRVDATFDGDADVLLVGANGRTYSLLGGRTGLRVRGAASESREELTLRSLPVGTYYVVVARAEGADEPVRGEVRIRAYDATRSVPFVAGEGRTTVARIAVTQSFRLEF